MEEYKNAGRCNRLWEESEMVLGFKSRHSSHVGLFGPWGLAKVGTVQLWGAPFLPPSLGSRRDLAWKKRGERILAGGP